MSYQGQRLEIRSTKSETNPKSQTAILKRRGAPFEVDLEMALPFCSFFSAGKKEQKGRTRSTAKPMCPSSLCLEFAVWIIAVCFGFRASDFGFLTAEDKHRY